MPANSEPTITLSAPAAIALTTSPEYLIPPSAMIGTPRLRATAAHSRIAEICGTPTPATTRVVQIDPGPMPSLTPSAPASHSAVYPSGVAMLPATICSSG